ncbi:MAG: T9SS type A sorting domain-containing protein [Bacteroidota bacterium]|nr:T9SS type A sorting domain-containing protein [Bacteroidota bacterium]
MKQILLICFLYSISISVCYTQDIFKFSPVDANVTIINVVDLACPSTLSGGSGQAILGFNYINTTSNQIFGACSFIEKSGVIATTKAIVGTTQNIDIQKLIHSGTAIYLIGAIGSNSQKAFIIKVNNADKSIIWSKIIAPNQPENNLVPRDIIISRNRIYILGDYYLNRGPAGANKMVLFSMDENGILDWNQVLNASDFSSDELAGGMTLSPRNSIIITGTSIQKQNFATNVLVADFQISGALIRTKKMQFYNGSQSEEYVPGKTFIKTNSVNIHLATQAIGEKLDAGSILITMLDTAFNLRTWRNYSPIIRMESFEIANSVFILSGQQPIEADGQGFGFVKINGANAIVEKEVVYKEGFKNTSAATTSHANFHGSWKNYIMAMKSNNLESNFIGFVINDADGSNPCETEIFHNVTKDPVVLSDLSFSAEPNNFTINDPNLSFDNFEFHTQSLCRISSTDETSQNEFFITPGISDGLFQLNKINEITFLNVFDVWGNIVYSQSNSISQSIDLRSMAKGIYFVSIHRAGKNLIQKIVVQ